MKNLSPNCNFLAEVARWRLLTALKLLRALSTYPLHYPSNIIFFTFLISYFHIYIPFVGIWAHKTMLCCALCLNFKVCVCMCGGGVREKKREKDMSQKAAFKRVGSYLLPSLGQGSSDFCHSAYLRLAGLQAARQCCLCLPSHQRHTGITDSRHHLWLVCFVFAFQGKVSGCSPDCPGTPLVHLLVLNWQICLLVSASLECWN